MCRVQGSHCPPSPGGGKEDLYLTVTCHIIMMITNNDDDNDDRIMIIMMMMLLGSDHLAGDTLVLAPVSRDHAGTYTCTGGGHRDTVTVTVQCELEHYSTVQYSTAR